MVSVGVHSPPSGGPSIGASGNRSFTLGRFGAMPTAPRGSSRCGLPFRATPGCSSSDHSGLRLQNLVGASALGNRRQRRRNRQVRQRPSFDASGLASPFHLPGGTAIPSRIADWDLRRSHVRRTLDVALRQHASFAPGDDDHLAAGQRGSRFARCRTCSATGT